ncbi:MAG: DoxX family protein [Flavitalea sp.]
MMKKIKIAYWIFTILMIAMMLLSAITSFFKNPDGIAMMQHIGYPYSVLLLLSVAKILGVITILLPGFPRLKEWAYAGFTFDLVGAVYAGLMAGDPLSQWAPVLVGLVFVFGSYITYHKLKGD